MALTKVSTDGVKDNAITKAKIPADQIEASEIAANAVGASELADNAVDTNAIADQAVTLDKLPHGDTNNDGKFLRANNGADPSFETISTVPADGSITSAKIEDGAIVNADVNASAAIAGTKIAPNFGSQNIETTGNLTCDGEFQPHWIGHQSQCAENTLNTDVYWKVAEITGAGSEGGQIVFYGTTDYSGLGSNVQAARTTVIIRHLTNTQLAGIWHTESGDYTAITDVRWKYTGSNNVFEIWVRSGAYSNVVPHVTGSFDYVETFGTTTGSATAPNSSTAFEKVFSIDRTKVSFTPSKNANNDGFEIIPRDGSSSSYFKVLGNNNAGADGRNGGVVLIDANYYVSASDIFQIKGRGTQVFNMYGHGGIYHSTTDVAYQLQIAGAVRFKLIHTGGGNMELSNPSSGNVTYSTSSDYRLKENATTINNALATVKALKPYQFTWKHDSKIGQGFFAHEVLETTPNSQAALGTKDAVEAEDDDTRKVKKGDPIYQRVDYSKLVPLLTAALQEAVAKIEVLETKVATLEAS